MCIRDRANIAQMKFGTSRGPSAPVFVFWGILNENVKYCRKAVCYQIMQEKPVLKVAAIGVGSLGRHHARNYAELAVEGRVKLAGVCDADPAAAAAIGSSHETSQF